MLCRTRVCHLCCVICTDLLFGGRQALRFLADDSIAEHNMRRALMRRIVSKSVELQLCDLSGACSTQALLDLGPQARKINMREEREIGG